MYPKSKRKRPNLEAAHQWLKEGVFCTNPATHHLSREELDNEISEVVEDLKNLPLHFPKTQNLEYAILKSHLIIEHIIRQYIKVHSRVLINTDQIRFSFGQMLEVAYLMGFGVNDPAIIPFAELMNRVRNQVAHTFLVDRKVIDEAIRIGSGPDLPPPKNDRERVRDLRRLCKWYCGFFAGWIEGEYYAMHPTDTPAVKG